MTEHLAMWATMRASWLAFARASRAKQTVAKVDQYDAHMRTICDELGVDLHDPKQRHAMQVGAILVLGQLPAEMDDPRKVIQQAGANVLGPTLAPWWETAK